MSIDIPNYRAIEKLGEGAQTRIFRARCMRTGKDYAVKVVKVVKPEDMSFVDLLRAEYAIGSSVDHPVIRKVYELRIMRQRLRVRGAILFMEYVPGVSMSDREFSRSLDELLGLMRQAAEGLHAMHLAGWVHADIKPNNILVTPDNLVKLIDLGQSSRMREAKTRVQGTIDYMAPEQAQRGVLDQRTDVFGVGAALHRVVVGRPVLTEMNQTVSLHSQSLVGKRLEEVRKPMLDVLPTCVARLIDDCCKADPHDRISDMPALMERIELARAILCKQAAAVPAAPSPPGQEDDDSAEDALGDAIFEQLGLPADGDSSVDIEDFGDLREE